MSRDWWSNVQQGAVAGGAIGAAAGTVVPGVGNAVGAVAGTVGGGLVGLARSLWPETVGGLLDGPAGAQVAPLVENTLRQVAGAESPGAVTAAIAADPELGREIEARLNVMAEMERIAAADRKDARAAMAALAQTGSSIAWGAPVVSVIVLVAFAGTMALTLLRAIPPGSETVLNVLLGTLAAMATSVVSFWVGSSAGSQRKTDLLAAERERR